MKSYLFFIILFLSSLLKAQNAYTLYPLPVEIASSLTSSVYTKDIVFDSTGHTWIITQKGIAKFDETTWTVYNTSNSSIPTNIFSRGFISPSNELWLTSTIGVVKFDGSTWTTFNATNSGLPTNSIKDIAFIGSETWFATNAGIIHLSNNNWTTFNTSNSALINDTITSLTVRNNLLYVGTIKGLTITDGSSFTTYNNLNSGLSKTNIKSIFKDATNLIWISASGETPDEIFHCLPNNQIVKMEDLNDILNVADIPTQFKNGPAGGVAYYGKALAIINHQEKRTLYPQIQPWNITTYSNWNYNPSNGLFWYVEETRQNLVSFDPLNYTHVLGNLTIENTKSLDVNEVRALISNRGDMFWNMDDQACYEVPKGSGKQALFASALWMGGLDNGGNLHQASMTYRQTGLDFWPGPLDTLSGSIDSATATSYDKIWKLNRQEINDFVFNYQNGNVQNGSYNPGLSILTWPGNGSNGQARKLAPFVDVDGDGLYKPLSSGDYPLIKGDQMLFWIFNDNIPHTETEGLPFKAEIHGSAYAYNCPDAHDSNKVINYTTYYNYKIFNRSNEDYTNMHLGIWTDPDLGDAFDDYIGSNQSGNYTYTFNGDVMDGDGSGISYGLNPPMVSTAILKGPEAEANDGIDNNNNGIVDEPGEINKLSNSMYYVNDFSPRGNPENYLHFYQYLKSIWKDGTSLTYGSNGYAGTTPTNITFPDFPGVPAGWHQTAASDSRIIAAAGPFSLPSQSSVDFDYAYVWTRDTTITRDSLFIKNKDEVAKINHWFNSGSIPGCPEVTTGIHKKPNLFKASLYPNPAEHILNINITGNDKMINYQLCDVQGKLVNSGIFKQGINLISTTDLNPGVYLIRLTSEGNVATLKFIKR